MKQSPAAWTAGDRRPGMIRTLLLHVRYKRGGVLVMPAAQSGSVSV